MIKALLFDWGDTIMRDDLNQAGPMFFWKEVSWIPGLKDVLHKFLAHKYLCVVASNSGESDTPLMIKALNRIHADEYFHSFYTSYDIGCEKPNPAFFQFIADALQLKANECIMIGNNYKKDIEGAKSVGMFTIWFNENEVDKRSEFSAADQIIFDMNQLLDAIVSIDT